MKLLNILKLITGKGVSALWAETKGSQANISKIKNVQSIGQNTEKGKKEMLYKYIKKSKTFVKHKPTSWMVKQNQFSSSSSSSFLLLLQSLQS